MLTTGSQSHLCTCAQWSGCRSVCVLRVLLGKALGAACVGAGTVLEWSSAVYLTRRDSFKFWFFMSIKFMMKSSLHLFSWRLTSSSSYVICAIKGQNVWGCSLKGLKLSSFSTGGPEMVGFLVTTVLILGKTQKKPDIHPITKLLSKMFCCNKT